MMPKLQWRRGMLLVLLLGCIGISVPPIAHGAGDGKLMYNGESQYSRVIKLSDGSLLAAHTAYYGTNNEKFRFYKSTNNGDSFSFQYEWMDSNENGWGICANSIYELPRQIGNYPAGTLLLGYNVVDDSDYGKGQKLKIQVSTNKGQSWSPLATLENWGTWNWEPEFTVSSDGKLQVYYSYSPAIDQNRQYIVRKETSDLVSWSGRIQAIGDEAHANGMVRIVKAGSQNKWFAAVENYEIPGNPITIKTSTDGKNWGSFSDVGYRVERSDGKLMYGTPALEWINSPQYPQGILVVVGWYYRLPNGADEPTQGRWLLYNTNGGSGVWYETEAPFTARYGSRNVNYSPTLLALSSSRLLFVSQSFTNNTMSVRYDTGPVMAAPIGKTVWLKSADRNAYVSAWLDLPNAPLQARAPAINLWEKFVVEDAGWGAVALKSLANGKYVSAWFDEPNGPLQARSALVSTWEQFFWEDAGGGKIALRSRDRYKYAAAWFDLPYGPLQARSDRGAGSWEQFTWGETQP